jgi:Icc protein
MRILQITDLHIGGVQQDTFGIDVRKNFNTILEKARDNAPDHIVITGDLCYESGDLDIYDWIHRKLESVNIPYSIIAGNHDNSSMIADVFGLNNLLHKEGLYYRINIAGQKVLYLDTSKDVLPAEQVKWLEEEVSNGKDRLIIFMHHPPANVGVPFMDQNYPLKNYSEVQKILLDADREIHVFCGHYHIEKTVIIGKLNIHITPSTFFQLDQQSASFKVDHHNIAYRELDWTASEFQTHVHYFKGHGLKKVI